MTTARTTGSDLPNRRDAILSGLSRMGAKWQQVHGKTEKIKTQAVWRGGDGYNVSILVDSGGWIDFKTGEKGGWPELARILGLDPKEGMPDRRKESREEYARRMEDRRQILRQQAEEQSAAETKRSEQAAHTYAAAWDILDHRRCRKLTGNLIKDMLTELKIRNIDDFGKHIPPPARLGPEDLQAGFDYLEQRNALLFARISGARIGKETIGTGENMKYVAGRGNFEIVWPIRKYFSGGIIGIQRETGRGHGKKAMAGLKRDGGFTAKPWFRHPSWEAMPENPCTDDVALRTAPPIAIVCEGPITGAALWNATGLTVHVCFDAGNMKNFPIHILRDTRENTPALEQVWIAVDHDRMREDFPAAGETGQKAAIFLAERIAKEYPEITVRMALPPKPGDDWADHREAVADEKDFFEDFYRAIRTDDVRLSAHLSGVSTGTSGLASETTNIAANQAEILHRSSDEEDVILNTADCFSGVSP